MKRVLVFDYYLGGHHLEYLHHLYEGAILRKDVFFLFALPSNFTCFSSSLTWSKAYNIEFLFFDCDEVKIRRMNMLRKSFYLSTLLKSIIKKSGISNVILLETMVFLPFLPFINLHNVKISSILYAIYLYRKTSSKLNKLLDNLKYLVISSFACFRRVYILNDRDSALYFNNKYSVDKFLFLPDPFYPISLPENVIDFRRTYHIVASKKIMLHFGGMTKRKGTMEILKAIDLLDGKTCENYCFIFAGRVIDDIREEFYLLIERLKKKIHIIVFDEFCEYNFLGLLCKNANYILIPYQNSAQSSGVLAYAAQFGVPVVGPADGLIGRLIVKYGLGICLADVSHLSIFNYLISVEGIDIKIDVAKSQQYINENSIENFIDVLYCDIV